MSATLTRELVVAQTRALKLPGIARTFDGQGLIIGRYVGGQPLYTAYRRWQVNTFSLVATDGTAVCFQVNQGDDGELSDLVGPYEIHDSGYPGGTNPVTGEEWGS